MLNLWDITSKFCAVTIFVIVDLQTVFHMQWYVYDHVCTKCHVPTSTGLSVIAIRLTAKENLLHVCILYPQYIVITDCGILKNTWLRWPLMCMPHFIKFIRLVLRSERTHTHTHTRTVLWSLKLACFP
jgi:hypothetical protein